MIKVTTVTTAATTKTNRYKWNLNGWPTACPCYTNRERALFIRLLSKSTGEISKEAIAHYPEIIKEIKLAVQECGRKLGMHLRRQNRIKQELAKRGYIETYLPYIGEALQEILSLKDVQVKTIVSRLKEVLEKSRKV
jgi:DNA topoisomerase VI subunit B